MTPRPRPSAAWVIAGLALFVAVSGTAYAAGTINGRSITDHTIAGRKLVDNTLTGKQIKESRLGRVPHAANADKVGGLTVRKVFYAPKTNSTTPKTILSLGGLVLSATCPDGIIEVDVTSTVEHAHYQSQMWVSAGGGMAEGDHLSDFGATSNSASHVTSLGNGNSWGETSFTYTRANGTTVTGQLSYDSSHFNAPTGGDGHIFHDTAKCLVSGFATSTTAAR